MFESFATADLLLSDTPSRVEVVKSVAPGQALRPLLVVGLNSSDEIVPAVYGEVQAIGFIPTWTAVAVGGTGTTPVIVAGHYNSDALAWDASYNSDTKRRVAFANAPAPTQMKIGVNKFHRTADTASVAGVIPDLEVDEDAPPLPTPTVGVPATVAFQAAGFPYNIDGETFYAEELLHGGNGADVPLYVNVDGDGDIHARFRRADTGAIVKDWALVDSVVGAGNHTVTATGVPLVLGSYIIIEVSQLDGSVIECSHRVTTGLTVWSSEQSEIQQMVAGTYGSLTPATLAAENLSITYQVFGLTTAPGDIAAAPVTERITAASPRNAVMVAIANAFHWAYPGLYVQIAFGTRGQSGYHHLVKDGTIYFGWDEDLLPLYNMASLNGAKKFGVVPFGWTTSPHLWGYGFANAACAFLTGRKMDGVLVTPGETLSGLNISTEFDHTLRDILGDFPKIIGYTRRYDYPPTGADADYDGYERTSSGGIDSETRNRRVARQQMKEMLSNAPVELAGRFLNSHPYMIGTYRNGDATSTTPWADRLHGGKFDDNDGLVLSGYLWAHMIAHACGLPNATWDQPVVGPGDVAIFTDRVEVTCRQGAITTVGAERGEAVGNTKNHWTDVMDGLEFNHFPVRSGTLSAGKAVFTPTGLKAAISKSDILLPSRGSGVGTLTTADYVEEIWKRYPVVNVGLGGAYNAAGDAFPYFPLSQVYDDAIFKNTLAMPSGTFALSATNQYLTEARHFEAVRVSTPSGSGIQSVLTMSCKINLASGNAVSGSTNNLMNLSSGISGNNCRLAIKPSDGSLALRVTDSSNTVIAFVSNLGATYRVPLDAWTIVRLVIDFSVPSASKVAVVVDKSPHGGAVEVYAPTGLPASSGLIDSDGGLQVFFQGGSFVGMDVEYFGAWREAQADNSEPDLDDTFFLVAGDNAEVNLHRGLINGPIT